MDQAIQKWQVSPVSPPKNRTHLPSPVALWHMGGRGRKSMFLSSAPGLVVPLRSSLARIEVYERGRGRPLFGARHARERAPLLPGALRPSASLCGTAASDYARGRECAVPFRRTRPCGFRGAGCVRRTFPGDESVWNARGGRCASHVRDDCFLCCLQGVVILSLTGSPFLSFRSGSARCFEPPGRGGPAVAASGQHPQNPGPVGEQWRARAPHPGPAVLRCLSALLHPHPR